MFVRFKLLFDPICHDLSQILREKKDIKTILDIGCGYGVPACWCLEQYKEAVIFGIDPDPERVRVAAIAAGDRGTITTGWAPEIPPMPGPADAVLLLDMLHYLDDETAAAIFLKSFHALNPKGLLVARCTIHPSGRPSWSWRLEDRRIQISGRRPWYRSPEVLARLMQEAGFAVIVNEVSAANPELVWLVGRTENEAVHV